MAGTLVKICGISTPETLAAAVGSGASHVGFVHFAKSPRHLSLADAAVLRRLVPPQVKAVLLVVNASPEVLAEAVRTIAPDVVQFHGAETPDTLARFRAETGIEAWRALAVKDAAALTDAARFHGAADRLLFFRLEPAALLRRADALGPRGRPHPRQCCRRCPPDRRAAGRHLLRRRTRPRHQGRGQNRRLLQSGQTSLTPFASSAVERPFPRNKCLDFARHERH
jgi:hypothetical protein